MIFVAKPGRHSVTQHQNGLMKFSHLLAGAKNDGSAHAERDGFTLTSSEQLAMQNNKTSTAPRIQTLACGFKTAAHQ
jgi:hypothetical protein